MISYLLRVCISPAATTVQRELKIDDRAMGYVLGGFFLGYFWFQVPAGWLGTRYGARRSLAAMGLLWALSITLAAFAPDGRVMVAAQVAQGTAQAGLFAVTIMALADWFPASRRGTASAAITACMSVGAALASGLTARLLDPLGWRGAFLLYAALAALWALAFLAWFRDAPETHPAVNLAELEFIRGPVSTPRPAPAARGSAWPALRAMAVSGSFVALCVQAFFRAFGYAFFITWFPAYLEKGHGVKVDRAGELTVMPLVGVVLGSFAGGTVVDAVLARTGSRWWSRSGVAAAALGLCGACTLAAAGASRPALAVAVIAVGAFFSGLGGPTTWAATMDLGGPHTALGFAVMNMAGNLGAIACPVAVGYLIDHLGRTGGDWNLVLYLFAAVYAAGAASWLFLDPDRPIDVATRPSQTTTEPAP